MIQLHQLKQGDPEWHKLREGLYTGSNAHKLLKFGAIDYSLTEASNFRGNFHTRRGHVLEDEAIELYEQIKKTKGFRFPDGEKVGFVTNSKFPTCGYSPDDLYPDRTIEVKAFEEAKHMQMFNGEIPLTVLAQCYFGMLICDKKICDLLIYNPALDPKKYTVKEMFKIITIKQKPLIKANFIRRLKPKEVAV